MMINETLYCYSLSSLGIVNFPVLDVGYRLFIENEHVCMCLNYLMSIYAMVHSLKLRNFTLFSGSMCSNVNFCWQRLHALYYRFIVLCFKWYSVVSRSNESSIPGTRQFGINNKRRREYSEEHRVMLCWNHSMGQNCHIKGVHLGKQKTRPVQYVIICCLW